MESCIIEVMFSQFYVIPIFPLQKNIAYLFILRCKAPIGAYRHSSFRKYRKRYSTIWHTGVCKRKQLCKR